MKIVLILLCFGQSLFAADFGTFVIVKGKVSVEDAKSLRREAKVNSSIYPGETVMTDEDSRAKIVMSDRNVINVLPNTKLKIEKYSTAANDRNVKLNLIEGRVRNRVGPYDNKTSKFEIRTGTSVAGVRGTEFIVGYDAKTKVTEVITLAGKVGLRSATIRPGEATAKEVIVNSHERLQHNGEAEPAKPKKIPKKEFDSIKQETSVKSEKKEQEEAARAELDKNSGAPSSETDAGGKVGTTPVGTTPDAPPTPGYTPPTKTNVNIQIKF